ncbi:MAG TPA: NAD-dependent epimerase/dehydratase family protein [Candidatus Eremiobacteraceae bacterium]|nr:NAD-dependent epimerase/dehydratase family protein [Candidatus Eremiobacteraceae bacterium]
MKYFVTGATGFIGGHVARQLVLSGHTVVALARDPSRAGDLARLGVAVHAGDITDAASLRAPMAGVDGVFHIAGWYKIGARDTSPGQAINVDGTRNVLTMMKELGVPKGVYTSTLAVNGDTHGNLVDESYRTPGGPWLTEYDRTKWVAHHEVAEPMIRQGLPLVIVMPGAVYGPGDTSAVAELFAQYLKGRLPLLPRGAALCWGYVDDIARAHIRAMEAAAPGETYIIAGPPHTLIDALALAEQFTGIKAPRFHPGPATMRALAAFMDAVGTVFPLPPTYTGEALRAGAATYIGDNSKAKRALGYDPRPLAAGLRLTLPFDVQREPPPS